MKKINFEEAFVSFVNLMPGPGMFINSKAEEKVNTMTLGWASMGNYWGKSVLIAMVRHSRYTYDLITKSGEFTISMPLELTKEIENALSFCGSNSGRDVDKATACGLTWQDSASLDTPIIAECALHIDCKIIMPQDMDGNALEKSIYDVYYPTHDLHTFFAGEIIETYYTK